MATNIEEVALIGARLPRKLGVAFVLSSLVPLGANLYLIYGYVMPTAGQPDSPTALTVQLLALCLALLCLGGYAIWWDVVRGLTLLTGSTADPSALSALARRRDDLGHLVRTITTLTEQAQSQAREMGEHATQLHVAQQELQLAHARLQELATQDELTTLYNRRFLMTRLQEELARSARFSHPLAVAMIDLDYFKQINDHHGHAVGDAVLREIGHLLRQQTRGLDLVCRYGGEEFAIVMVETGLEGASQCAEKVRRAVEAHTFPGEAGEPLRVTVSIGLVGWQGGTEDAGALLSAADQALYEAKRQGRNRVVTAGAAPG